MPSGPEVGSAYVSILPSAKGFGSKLQSEIGGEVGQAGVGAGQTFGKGMSTGVTSTAGSLAKSVTGVFAAVGAARFLTGAIGEAREAAQVGRLTEAVIKSTGAAAGVSAGQVSELAGKLSLVGGVDDDLIQSAENVLLTFTAVRNEAGKGNDIFDQATLAASNMSAALGTDLQSNITAVGKALQDPAKGAAALSRSGSLAKTDLEELNKMAAAGVPILEQQKFILAALEKQYGGAFAAAADPAAKAQVAWKNFQEQLGTSLLPVLNSVATVFANDIGPVIIAIVEGFSALPGPIQASVVGLLGIGAVAGPIGRVASGLKGLFVGGGKAAVGLGKVIVAGARLGASMLAMGGRIATAGVQMAVAGARSAATFAASLARAAASALVASAQMIGSFIATAAAAVLNAAIMVAAWLLAAAPFILLGLLIAGVVIAIIKNWDTISSTTVAVWDAITSFVTDAVGGMVDFISGAISNVVGFFVDLPGNILGALGDFGSLLLGLGGDLLRGLWSGIESALGWLYDKISGLAGGIVDKFKSALRISSPSKVFMELGGEIPAGLAIGIRSGAGLVRLAATDMMPSLVHRPFTAADSANFSNFGPATTAAGTSELNINLNGPVHIRSDEDITKLGRDLYQRSARERRARGIPVAPR